MDCSGAHGTGWDTYTDCDWNMAGYDDTHWLAWKVMGVAEGLARVTANLVMGFHEQLELSSSVPTVLIRASATILPKDSSLNSWFNEIIVIHELTTMWHVNVFFLIRGHYFVDSFLFFLILTSLKEPNNVERHETNKVILRLQVLTTVLRSLWKLTSETYCNIIIYMEVFKPKHCVQWRAFKKGGYTMLLVITLYCIWWLLKESCFIQVTEVTFHCCRGVCHGNSLRYNSFL